MVVVVVRGCRGRVLDGVAAAVVGGTRVLLGERDAVAALVAGLAVAVGELLGRGREYFAALGAFLVLFAYGKKESLISGLPELSKA